MTDDDRRTEGAAGLDEIVREGARRMLAAALEAEVDSYVAAFADERDEQGHRLVVRNGHAEARTITTAAGPVEIQAPRVNDKRTDPDTATRYRFRSAIVPPWCRKSPKVTEVLPLLYLHGLSTGDFVPALEEFFGSAAGLSSTVISRLTKQWQAERGAFMNRDLSDVDYVYVWADGVHFKIRLEEANLCALVIVGVRADGTKELVAIADGLRESTESWADLLRDLKRRGMRAPALAVGDGALGFWGALAQVFPPTRHQRDWVHKAANVLNALPTSAHPSAKRMLGDIRDAEDRDHAVRAIDAFAAEFAARWPKAVGRRLSRKAGRCSTPAQADEASFGRAESEGGRARSRPWASNAALGALTRSVRCTAGSPGSAAPAFALLHGMRSRVSSRDAVARTPDATTAWRKGAMSSAEVLRHAGVGKRTRAVVVHAIVMIGGTRRTRLDLQHCARSADGLRLPTCVRSADNDARFPRGLVLRARTGRSAEGAAYGTSAPRQQTADIAAHYERGAGEPELARAVRRRFLLEDPGDRSSPGNLPVTFRRTPCRTRALSRRYLSRTA